MTADVQTAPIAARKSQEVLGLSIGGQERMAADGRTFAIENPATGGTAYVVARGAEADIDLAVAAARRAADGAWPVMHPRERGRILRRAAGLLAESADELAEIETRSVGRSIREMRQQVRRVPE